MTQLTLRKFDQELDTHLPRECGLSLNIAALLRTSRLAGLTEEGTGGMIVGGSLDELIGSWSPEQEREILTAVEAFEWIEGDLWP